MDKVVDKRHVYAVQKQKLGKSFVKRDFKTFNPAMRLVRKEVF